MFGFTIFSVVFAQVGNLLDLGLGKRRTLWTLPESFPLNIDVNRQVKGRCSNPPGRETSDPN